MRLSGTKDKQKGYYMFKDDGNKDSSSSEFFSKSKIIRIMLIDESEPDRVLALEALSDAHIVNQLTVCESFEEAWKHLGQGNKEDKAYFPDLILISARLYLSGATEWLKTIKLNNNSARIPIGVLTVTEEERSYLQASGLPADCILLKPEELANAGCLIKCFRDFKIAIIKTQGMNS